MAVNNKKRIVVGDLVINKYPISIVIDRLQIPKNMVYVNEYDTEVAESTSKLDIPANNVFRVLSVINPYNLVLAPVNDELADLLDQNNKNCIRVDAEDLELASPAATVLFKRS
jgi:hypothetical protein